MDKARTIAVGDIHGCLKALNVLLEALEPQPKDTIVTLGDYVDRGENCRGTLDRLLKLETECHLIPLLGNHDDILLDVHAGGDDLRLNWLGFGGRATLRSYKTTDVRKIPARHIDFLRRCKLFHETKTHIFIHGSYLPNLPMVEQPRQTLLWGKMRPQPPAKHRSGKTVIVGHTAQRDGKILDAGHLLCIDTCCYGDGWLTALDVKTGNVWQANRQGKLRATK